MKNVGKLIDARHVLALVGARSKAVGVQVALGIPGRGWALVRQRAGPLAVEGSPQTRKLEVVGPGHPGEYAADVPNSNRSVHPEMALFRIPSSERSHRRPLEFSTFSLDQIVSCRSSPNRPLRPPSLLSLIVNVQPVRTF